MCLLCKTLSITLLAKQKADNPIYAGFVCSFQIYIDTLPGHQFSTYMRFGRKQVWKTFSNLSQIDCEKIGFPCNIKEDVY